MDALTDLLVAIRASFDQVAPLSWTTLPLPRRDAVVMALGAMVLVAVAAVLVRTLTRRPGRTDVALPAIFPVFLTRRSRLAPVRHLPFGLFLAGLPCFALALGDPHTSLIQERATFPGHRIAILIDASLSMDSSFATDQLGWGNTCLLCTSDAADE